MFAFAVVASVLASAVAAVHVDTPPSLVQCQPVSLTFDSGTAPYYIAAIPASQANAAAIANIATVNSSPYTWTVNLAAGTAITIKVTDGTGNIAYSSPLTVQSGASSSCLSASGSSAVSGSSSMTGSASASAASGSASSAAGGVAASASSVSMGAASSVSSASRAVSSATSAGSSATSASSGNAASSVSSAAASATSRSAAQANSVVGGALAVAGVVAAVLAA